MNSPFQILMKHNIPLEKFEKELIYDYYCDFNEKTREGISFREWCTRHNLLTDETVIFEEYKDYADEYDTDYFTFSEICDMMILEHHLPLQKITNDLYLEGASL